MCKIKLVDADSVVRMLKEFQTRKFDVDEISSLYVNLNSIIKELEEQEEIIKDIFREYGVKTYYVPDAKKKIVVKEAREVPKFENPESIHKSLSKAGLNKSFYDIVNISVTEVNRLDDSVRDKVSDILNSFKKVSLSKEAVTVSNMTKVELAEHNIE